MGSGATKQLVRAAEEWLEVKEERESKKLIPGIPDWAQPKPGQTTSLNLRRMDIDLGNVEDAKLIKTTERRKKGQRARKRFAEAQPPGDNGSFKHISKAEVLARRKKVLGDYGPGTSRQRALGNVAW
jgi:hypothetical protein